MGSKETKPEWGCFGGRLGSSLDSVMVSTPIRLLEIAERAMMEAE